MPRQATSAPGCPLQPGPFVADTTTFPKEDDVKYLLQIYPAGARERMGKLSAEDQAAIIDEFRAIMATPGAIGGEQLQPAESATTVRVERGETLLTDGPFMDAKEHLGGYLLVDVDDLDAALDFAARIPTARFGGAVEVRPLVQR
jgi:hypothetical protein